MTEENINDIAREIGFVVRDYKKFDGFKFLFTDFNHKELTLNSMALQLQDRYGILLSKQAVDIRFSELSVKFLKLLLEKVLKLTIQKSDTISITNYNRVRIKDSTTFKLPENMKDKYPKGNKADTIT